MNVRRTSLGNRILAMLLVAVMVLGMVPATAFQAKAADTTGNPDVTSNADTILAYAQGKLDENHDKTGQYTWDTEKKTDGWRYFNGLMLEAFLRNGLKANETETALTFAQKYFDHNVKEGSSLSNAVPDMAQTELDGIPPARVLAQLVGHVGFTDAKYANAVELIYKNTIGQKQVSGTDGNFIHKENDSSWENWQIGLDGLYMAQPFLMETAKAIHENRLSIDGVSASSIADGVYARFNWVSTNMKFETEEGSGVWLYHHGWGPEGNYKNGNGVTWSRGVGWYAAGLADCIALMEDIGYDSAKVSVLKGHLKTLLDGMLAYQDASGLWNNVVYVQGDGVPSSNNFLETSGTGLMAYTLLVAYTEGWLGSTYGQAGVKAIDGIMSKKYEGGKFIHILKSSGVETSASGYNSTQSSDEAKGTGAIILAASMYDDAVAGTSYAETYQIGLVNVTELDVVNGAVQTSSLKATVVGSKGTIKDVAAANLTTAYNAEAKTVAISYNGNVIATVDANVIDVSAKEESNGSLTITPEASVPTGGTTTAEGTVTVAGTAAGTTTYTMVTGDTFPGAGKYVIVYSADGVNGKTLTGYADAKTSNTEENTPLDVTIEGTTLNFGSASADDIALTIWEYTSNSSLKDAGGNYLQSGQQTEMIRNTEIKTIAFTKDTTANTWAIAVKEYRYLGYNSSNGFIRGDQNKTGTDDSHMYVFKVTTSTGSTETKDYTVTLTTTDTGKLLGNTDPVQLNAELTASDSATIFGDIVWDSSDDAVATVSTDGKVTAVANGNANITATVSKVTVAGKEVTLENALVVTIPVTVSLGATYNITLDCTGVSVEVGGKGNLEPTLTIEGYTGKKVAVYEYVSADSKIATVTANGEVSGVATGTTDITITLVSVDGVNVSGVSVTVPVAVTEKTCEHDYASSVTAPTCTQQGYTTYTCSKCEHSYEGDFVAALGHSFGTYTETKAATCGAAGEQTATCSKCGAVDTKAIPATGEHNYADGSCTLCGGTEPGYVEPGVDFNTPSVDGATESAATIVAGGSISLTASLTNADNYSLSWSILENADYATLVDNGDGTATVTAKTNVVTPVVVKIQAKLTKLTRAAADTYTATYDITINPTAADKTGDWEIIEYTTTGGETTGGTTTTVTTYELVTGTTFPGAGNYVIVYKATGDATSGYAAKNPGSNGRAPGIAITLDGTKVNFGSTSAGDIAASVWKFTASGSGYTVTNGSTYGLKSGTNDIVGTTHATVLITKGEGDNWVLEIGETGRYLGFSTSKTWFTRDGSDSADEFKIYLYKETTKTETTGGSTTPAQTNPSKWAQLSYKDYTVVAGSITEEALIAQIKADCSIATNNASDGTGDTTGTYDWANATLTWDKTLDTDAADTYKATVTVPVENAPADAATVATLGTITVTVESKEEHVHSYTSVVTAPTCTAQGYTTHTCTCGDIVVDTYVDALGHTEEAIPPVDATCTTAGSTAGVKCSVCDEVITAPTTIPATGHTDANGDYECDTCGTALQNPTDYIHDFTIGAFPADEEIFTATVNNGSTWDSNLEHSTLPALGYNSYYKLVATDSISFTAPSAGTLILKMKGRNQDGYTNSVTVTDGANKATEFTAISKTELVEETVAITAGGTVTIAASNGQPVLYYIEFQPEVQCEHANTQVIPAVAATCKDTGLTEGEKCTDCGEILVEQTVTDKLTTHTWGENGVETQPDCETDGKITYTCTVCGATKDEPGTPSQGHQYVNGKCEHCGLEETVTKPTGEYKPVSTTTQGGGTGTWDGYYNIATAPADNMKFVFNWNNERTFLNSGTAVSRANADFALVSGTTDKYSITCEDGTPYQFTLKKHATDATYAIYDDNGYYVAHGNEGAVTWAKTGDPVYFTISTTEANVTGAFFFTYTGTDNDTHYLTNATGGFSKRDSANVASNVLIYTPTPVTGGTTTVTEYYAISPITATYDAGTNEDIASAIKGRVALWKATAANGADADLVTDADVTVDISAVETNIPGKYEAVVYMTVGDEQVEIGRVPVEIVATVPVVTDFTIDAAADVTLTVGDEDLAVALTGVTMSDGSQATGYTIGLTSDDASVTIVDGKLHAVAAGNANVTVQLYKDGVAVDGQTKTIAVTAKEITYTYTVNGTVGDVVVGGEPNFGNITVTKTGSNGSSVTIENADLTFGTYSTEEPGEQTVEVTADGKVIGTVKFTVAESAGELTVTVHPDTLSVPRHGYEEIHVEVSLNGQPIDAGDYTLTWTSENPNVATVTQSEDFLYAGIVYGVSQGATNITANVVYTDASGNVYNGSATTTTTTTTTTTESIVSDPVQVGYALSGGDRTYVKVDTITELAALENNQDVILVFNQGSHYAADVTDSLGFDSQRLKPTLISGDTYSLAPYSASYTYANRWIVTKAGTNTYYLSTVVGDKTYYLTHEGNELGLTETQSNDCIWTVRENNSSGVTSMSFYYMVGEKYYQLQANRSALSLTGSRDSISTSSERQAVVYVPNEVGGTAVYTYARVDGITSYVIEQGDTLTEAMILENIKVQLSTSEDPELWEDLAWTDSRINYNWRGVNLDTNVPGGYAMAIRVNNQLVHRVFVNVEPAAYTVEITSDASVAMDNSITATATVKDSSGNAIPGATVTWSSANPSIAAVNADTGVITGKINGDTTITATYTIGGKTYTASKKITVTSKVNYEKYIQNLTTEGFEDNLGFYTFSGNHNVGNADPITYNGSDLDTFMKMESSTDVYFTADTTGRFEVIAAKTSATVKLTDGTNEYTPTVESTGEYTKYIFTGLEADKTYHLKKDSSQALVAYMEFIPDGERYEVIAINIELENDDDELIINGGNEAARLTEVQASATVTADGNAHDDAFVVWGSEDESVVTVSTTGLITAVGVGQTYVTASHTHTYKDGSTDTYTDRYLVFVRDGNVIVDAQLSDNDVTFDINDTITAGDLLDDNGDPITLKLIDGTGYETSYPLTADGITFSPSLDSLGNAAGIKTVLVSYNGGTNDSLTVRLVDTNLAQHDGVVQQESNVLYTLETSDIDDGGVYVLVAVTEPAAEGSNTWKGVALLNPDDGTSNTKGTLVNVTGDLTTRTITFTGTAAEIANAEEFGLWTFDLVNADDETYHISNTNRYFRDGNSSYLTKESQKDAIPVSAYAQEGSYYFNLSSSYWLAYYDGAWVRTKTSAADANVYLFKRVSEYTTVGTDFEGITAPEAGSIHKGNAFTSVPTVLVNNVPTTDYTIVWTSSDETVATVDANGKVSYLKEGTATITATLTHISGEAVTANTEGALTHSFDVTVPLETTSLQITPDNIVVPLNGTVDLSEVRIVRVRQVIVDGVVTQTTYEDLNSDLITFDLVGANNKQGIDTGVAGASYEVDTYYDGVKQGTVTVNIGHDVFDGRDTATSLPEYPAGGAVRADKTAVNAEGFSFLETGVSKVEITAAGVTQQSDIDVILVVDVSNSMAWSMDWFEGLSNTDVSDAKKIPTDGVAGIDKLDMAMTHASTFADILLAEGNDNSLTFVTFAGCDTDNGGSNYDSVQTVFTGVTDASKAKTSFAGTRYTALSGSDGVTVTLQITDENGNSTKGTNRGNTNYDYAFGQAMSAINDMKDKWEADATKNPNGLTYDESGRQIHVVFMTDGAPSHYNGVRNGGSTSDTIYGTSTKYSNKSYSNTDWTAYIQNPNTLATQLYNTPGVTGFHTVGFDLAHGGFSSYSADATEMTYVLRGLVTSQDLDVVSAENEAQLQNFFESLAHSLTMAGREAYVTDIVGANYTLYMGTELLNDSNGEAIEGVPSEVNVKLYTLVTPSLIAKDSRFNASQIGQRVCDIEVDGQKIGEITSGENQNVTILEKITFTVDGTNITAHSSVKGDIAVVDGGFKASTFEYKVVDGKGNITWNIGDITHQEISLSYYAHLNGVADYDGVLPENGSYYTNESAHITYIDANEDKAVQEFPKPAMAFGSASIRFRFVLVAQDGRYANRAGNAFAEDVHANRIFTTEEVLLNVPLDQVKSFSSEDLRGLLAQVGLTSKYLTLASNVSFDIGIGNVTQKGLHNLVYTDIYDDVWSDGTHTHDFETLLNVTADDTYTQVTVELPVVSLVAETAQNRLFTASSVIDFGTPVDFEVAHPMEKEAFAADGYVMTVVGFAPYSASFDQKLMIKPALVGAGTKDMLATESGVFSIKTAGDANNNPVITFTPTAPINGVQKVFATIRFSVPGEETTSYYYMYKEINVIPASMMLVESDATVNVSGLGYVQSDNHSSAAHYDRVNREFATGFTYTGDWQQQSSGAISNQFNANENYGYDAGYANYANYAGNVMFVNNDGTGTIPTVKFSFTGTGFDLISRTGDKQAMISVVVSQNGKEVKRQVILLKSQDELYQIPVTSIEGLAYGTYDVVVTVNSAFSIGSYVMGGEFYFDGIRVYNAAMNDASANNLYKQAGEYGMILQEIRELLLAAESFGDGLVDGVKGALYFDGNDLNDGDEMPEGETFVTSYNKIGPKNEIYLSGGQAVAFKLGFSDELPTTLDLGLKLAKVSTGGSATATVTIYNATDVAAARVTTKVELNTATAMFYNILGTEQLSSLVDANNQIIVVISYDGEANLNDILSITDLKAGFSGDSVGKFEVISSTATVAAANLTLNPEFNVKSAQFESDSIVVLQPTTLTVVTSAGVDSILVTDENGNEIGVSADFMDTADGDRVWTILVRATESGTQTFTVTGVGADGQTGESATVIATVNLF